MEKQLQLVTIEQAKKLKELGFVWETDRYYALITDFHNQLIKGNIYKNSCINNEPTVVSAPTVALALKWFRDEEKADSCVLPVGFPVRYYQFKIQGCLWSGNFKTYEESENALLDELLKLLEDENKTA